MPPAPSVAGASCGTRWSRSDICALLLDLALRVDQRGHAHAFGKRDRRNIDDCDRTLLVVDPRQLARRCLVHRIASVAERVPPLDVAPVLEHAAHRRTTRYAIAESLREPDR